MRVGGHICHHRRSFRGGRRSFSSARRSFARLGGPFHTQEDIIIILGNHSSSLIRMIQQIKADWQSSFLEIIVGHKG